MGSSVTGGEFEEDGFEGAFGLAGGDQAGGGLGDEVLDLRGEFGRGVFDDELGLVFHAHEVVKRAFADHFAAGHDTDAVADFLDLLEEVGGEEDGLAAFFEVENEVADLV